MTLKAYALGEQIIIDTKAIKEGEEIKSSGGIVLGRATQGEVPLFGIVISVGEDVDQDVIQVGDKVLLPQGNIKNVPDPRIISGEMKQDDADRALWVHTHYKNVAAVYREE
ncbi:head assembly cochaperone with GroEL [Vibrio phage nt-1]|uniref:Head assembly cochaperone with GroEL n=1 Tax=Vibrio phage nt-1 TaxID=115992 RepID=R9TFD8_9CAUD|nr:head morphogenesis [Vibrio phage nt-1]AGN30179.1 head assembly cochaperone with GroEL [Vibrio phage nt-1]